MDTHTPHCTKCGRFRGSRLTHKCGFQKGGYTFKKQANNVAQQKHYTQFKIQPVSFIVANNLSYNQGNVIKYVCRYKEKDGLKDLHKARVYIDFLIQELTTGEVKP